MSWKCDPQHADAPVLMRSRLRRLGFAVAALLQLMLPPFAAAADARTDARVALVHPAVVRRAGDPPQRAPPI